MSALSTPAETEAVPFEDVAAFTRRLIHDARNGLNALDLQLAAILDEAELAQSPLRPDLMTARRMLSDEARRLSALSAQLRDCSAQLIDYRAADLVEDLRDRLERALPAAAGAVEWSTRAGLERVRVDFELLSTAALEFVRNALQFREGGSPIQARALIEDGAFVLEVSEARATVAGNPATWGMMPFRTTRRTAYGLGLFAARRAVAACGGTLEVRHDAEKCELRSRITLPLSPTS